MPETALAPTGVLIVNKPQGPTSHDVVQILRRALQTRRVGHAGSLDPMAEGVLVVLAGTALAFQQVLQSHRKRYDATIRLGFDTETGDAWGAPSHTAEVPLLDDGRVRGALQSLVGSLDQAPPAFSAVKHRGRPLYWWARRGMHVELPTRRVEISEAALVERTADTIRCTIECSSGTYIRALAETLAQRLGTRGHLARLVRLSAGPWRLEQARELEWLRADPAHALQALQPFDPTGPSHENLARA
ncbi:MAG: tRNA pseudouridine(55) synthase TruB [Candidatus Omnitrophica bacterium]|nr:tRNA pseudouridine(55) synthase TruB [Candidatus Omnitrophota bacterium]